MSDPRPKELIHAEELRFIGKVEECLEVIRNYEKKHGITPEERLWTLLLRGWVFSMKTQFKKAVEMGERTYTMSQELGLVPETIEALLLKVHCVFLGRIEEAHDCIIKAERLLCALFKPPPYYHPKIVELYLFLKSWVYFNKNDFNTALDVAEEGLALAEKAGKKTQIGLFLQLLCHIHIVRGEQEKGREYAMKFLDAMRNLDYQIGIAIGLHEFGQSTFYMGYIDKALELINESFKMSPERIKVRSLFIIGEIYGVKGLLDIALENYKKGLKLAREISHSMFIGAISNGIGRIYNQKGDLDQAKNYLEQGLTHCKEIGWVIGITSATLYLLYISLDENSWEQANQYISQLKKLKNQSNIKRIKQAYQLGKSFMLRASNRMRDNVKAEGLLKQIISEDIIYPEYHALALVSLCDLYLEELTIYNNQEVLEELNPLLTKLLDMAEAQNSILWLAEGTLAQAKLALIQMDLARAKTLLTQAQKIAEENGLDLLAQKISSEHDSLLEKVDEWDKLKREGAPMAERIELASFDSVINRLQGKTAVEPPELVEEEPILLLIMDNSGVTYFNHLFVAKWDHSDLFSSFMSAFNTFMDEIFSNSIDRIKVKENTILINPVESFLVCYVIKGQSYPALQKLTRFTEAIRENSEIWQALKKSVKTSEMLELGKPPSLKIVIDEIF